MVMQRHDSIVVIAAIGFLVYTLLLSTLGPVVSSLLTNRTIGNTGSVRAVGVGVYWDYNGTSTVNAFDWGFIEPGANKTITCYVKNVGNQVVTLSMSTSNWNPQNATQFMTLSWNREGTTLNPGQIITATFTLAVSASTQGITNFSFDVTITGSG